MQAPVFQATWLVKNATAVILQDWGIIILSRRKYERRFAENVRLRRNEAVIAVCSHYDTEK